MANRLLEFTVNKTIRHIGFTGEKTIPLGYFRGLIEVVEIKVVVYFMTKTIAL